MSWPLTPQDVVYAVADVGEIPAVWLFRNFQRARQLRLRDLAHVLLLETGMSWREAAEFLCRNPSPHLRARLNDRLAHDGYFAQDLAEIRSVAERRAEGRRLILALSVGTDPS